MPELPEVETVRRGLERWAAGRTIETVEIFGPRTLRRHQAGVADFVARVSGCRIEAACRRGKYLWLPLRDPHPQSGERGWGPATSGEAAGDIGPATSGEAVIAHLGMSGQFLAVPSMTPGQAHLRARFRFVDGDPEIRFVDQRTFGGLALDVLPEDGGLPARIAHIAPDPLEAAFDPEAFYRAIRRRRTGVKRALLDQSLVSGIGNIYADEALWRARMHYARGTDTLRRRDAEALVDAVRAVLEAAITAGGTSFDALYVAVNGESGYFDRSLEVYGREGEPCSRCGAAIVREHFMNRSSYRCPRCQRTPRHPRW